MFLRAVGFVRNNKYGVFPGELGPVVQGIVSLTSSS